MQKILLFLLLLVAVYYVRRMLVGNKKPTGPSRRQAPAQDARIETMLPCAHCGLLVPQSEGLIIGSHFYCSQEHARLGPSSGT